MHTVNLLISLVEHHQVLAYVIIFLGLIFEGEIIAISVGILAHLGALNFWFSIFFILVGAISKTLIFYELGEFLYKKFLKAEILGKMIWAPIMLSLGYFFSYTALNITREIWKFSMIIAVLFALFIIIDKLVSWAYEVFEEFCDKA